MAAPRVFVSSTYYDLQHVRNDVKIFLQQIGYEPVMHDKGNVTYSQGGTSLEESCYNELSTCDIVICIIGNKFGTKSSIGNYSITMKELQEAIKRRKKIYIYILKDVYGENFTYVANKANGFIPYHVDNIQIHQFISDLKEVVKNHPITSFETVSDITNSLRLQFAGLFQHLLSQEAAATEAKTYDDIQNATKLIEELILQFSDEKKQFFAKFDSTIYATLTPLRRILKLLNINNFQVFASTKESLVGFFTCLGFDHNASSSSPDEFIRFIRRYANDEVEIRLSEKLFDQQGYLKDIRDKNLLEEYISYESRAIPIHDDLPF